MERGKTLKHTKPFPGLQKTLKLEMRVAQDVVMNEQAALPDQIQV